MRGTVFKKEMAETRTMNLYSIAVTIYLGASQMRVRPGTRWKCRLLFETSGMEWRRANAAIQRSLSAMTCPLSSRSAFKRAYASQTDRSREATQHRGIFHEGPLF